MRQTTMSLVAQATVRSALFVLACVAAPAHAEYLGLWTFDSDFGDSSASNHDLSQVGNVTLMPGLVGNAAFFDGSGFLSCEATPLLADRNQFSIGAWIKQEGNPGPDAVLIGVFSPVFCMGLTDHYGRVWGYVHGGGNNVRGGTLGDGDWHHVVETFDGTTLRLYLDTRLVSSKDSSFPSTGNGSLFSIGGAPSPRTNFTGLLDEAFFTSDVLTQSQIAAMIPEPSTAVLLLSLAAGAFLTYAWRRYI